VVDAVEDCDIVPSMRPPTRSAALGVALWLVMVVPGCAQPVDAEEAGQAHAGSALLTAGKWSIDTLEADVEAIVTEAVYAGAQHRQDRELRRGMNAGTADWDREAYDLHSTGPLTG
jgi:hypothetical protein